MGSDDMNTEEFVEFIKLLRLACPGYMDIHGHYVGNYQVHIECIAPDGRQSTMRFHLDDDQEPAQWAHQVAKSINASWVATT